MIRLGKPLGIALAWDFLLEANRLGKPSGVALAWDILLEVSRLGKPSRIAKAWGVFHADSFKKSLTLIRILDASYRVSTIKELL